ncbi:MAG: hypothetical protein ACD_52C00048G0004 [uncultured bacterium]|uniref:Uncharacterized protein n=1 Tax=Candidatus Beckwithbacteria bacterium GW2011_GWB1_47_15 TaxID=1618371 RepID=A0A0G1U2J8_9BACT|nr:MAG: hypothetical protein ACD_52C00048G0004 [uncultured bacterium]KKT31452.1 MAG: hypothetical protein UW18_C0003G0036 [Microgenomates group bacterium GW2011_GWF1_44_10]KKU02423.1 MAG: hypothetical protein UX04_C0001G0194 [Microgenomates group bacterium GW2011_GWF2_45_18]KKU60583.1 MAG: hypothetical protein UX85_C0009G0036 [Candidatus Beckwithbacteria bacterium GW2011_GWB1_47_15]KKU71288.1 MAG: hypothetical protein UX97_C0009G0009 [Candidatus Beckwithbacteria bacterium GW2011_GWA2_47_25]HAU
MSTDSRPTFTTAQVNLTNADTWYSLPDIKIGEGCEVVIKSKVSNISAIKVAHDDAESKNAPFILDNPGDSLSLRIKGTTQVVVSSAIAGQVVEVITEQ